jgi:SpoVK/Ycf46/Vps4 family AAA+-type ATPase
VASLREEEAYFKAFAAKTGPEVARSLMVKRASSGLILLFFLFSWSVFGPIGAAIVWFFVFSFTNSHLMGFVSGVFAFGLIFRAVLRHGEEQSRKGNGFFLLEFNRVRDDPAKPYLFIGISGTGKDQELQKYQIGDASFLHTYSYNSTTEVCWFYLHVIPSDIQPGDVVAYYVFEANGSQHWCMVPLHDTGLSPVFKFLNRAWIRVGDVPPLSAQVKSLVHDFRQMRARLRRYIQTLELGPANAPQEQRSPEEAWKGISLVESVKQRLRGLGDDFMQRRPTASRGLLLYGPPGTGKTLIAKALAESMGCVFFPLSLPDLKGPYIGHSADRVKELWDKALRQPNAVIFVDECEGVFARRGGLNADSFVEEIVNAFIARWDGFNKQTSVWVIGATNRMELIDPAVLSRFDEQVEIGLPDSTLRLKILANELAALKVKASLPPQSDLLTQGMSGRDLAGIAKRLARRVNEGATLTDQLLQEISGDFRQQGSTKTASTARWDTLVLSESTLKDLKATATMLKNADTLAKKGISIPRGLLLYGPPGTGKTQIARTLANETGLSFIAVSTADIKQGYTGQSGQKVREIFARARESAPSLLFIDEIDIIAGVRGGANDSFQAEIVGQLLQEMDGAKVSPQHVFVLAATNRPDQVDSAVLSRLPKQIEIPLPDAEGLQKLLHVMLAGKPLAFDLEQVVPELAAQLTGKSGRELRNWVEQAEQNAIVRTMEAEESADSIALKITDFPGV